MTEDILKYLGQIIPLEAQDIEKFLSKFEPLSLKKGDFFIKEGQISRNLGFIIKGSMLCFFDKDGEDVIDEFSLDKEFITDYFSFLTNSPAEKSVKCLEDTELIIISFDEMEALYAQSPLYEKVGRLMAEGLLINWQQKAKSLMLDNAETRYLKLISRRPDLIQRVPQYLIASYLNIKPETLSRIRKKIASK